MPTLHTYIHNTHLNMSFNLSYNLRKCQIRNVVALLSFHFATILIFCTNKFILLVPFILSAFSLCHFFLESFIYCSALDLLVLILLLTVINFSVVFISYIVSKAGAFFLFLPKNINVIVIGFTQF